MIKVFLKSACLTFISLFCLIKPLYAQLPQSGSCNFTFSYKPFFLTVNDSLNEEGYSSYREKTIYCQYNTVKRSSDDGKPFNDIDLLIAFSADTFLIKKQQYFHLQAGELQLLRNPKPEAFYISKYLKYGNLSSEGFLTVNLDDSIIEVPIVVSPTDTQKAIAHLFQDQGWMNKDVGAKYYDRNDIWTYNRADSVLLTFSQSLKMDNEFEQKYRIDMQGMQQTPSNKLHPLLTFDSIKFNQPQSIVPTLDSIRNNLGDFRNIPALQGDSISLLNPSGYTMLEFWYISCLPCQLNIPVWNQLVDSFEGPTLQFIAINATDKDENRISEFLKSKPIKGKLSYGTDLHKFLGIRSFPTTLLLDANGNIIKSWQGYHINGLDAYLETIHSVLE